jgi:hypothetical protein
VLNKLKHQWTQLRRYPPGQRFRRRFEAQRQKAPDGAGWRRRLLLFGAIALCFVIGVVLMFMPGPAVLFFALAAALLAEESRWVARGLDRLELRIRAVVTAFCHWWSRRSEFVHVLVCLLAGLITGTLAFATYLILF